MANTYSQINIHCVFAVNGRENIITNVFREDLYRYMSGILKKDGSFPLAINGWKDHVHVFFEIQPSMAVSKQIQMLKATSSKWINENGLVKGRFNWQEGYGAFSYARSQRDNVIKYIMNQEEHHSKKTFKEEYLELLSKFEVSFESKYFFDFFE
ncbi:MAG: IS200/IS605 family transposase [Candidatus Moranbacteria bacterium]|nr:IS200/IS605 family transposase [Candidatus Moranbacteria bacterium]